MDPLPPLWVVTAEGCWNLHKKWDSQQLMRAGTWDTGRCSSRAMSHVHRSACRVQVCLHSRSHAMHATSCQAHGPSTWTNAAHMCRSTPYGLAHGPPATADLQAGSLLHAQHCGTANSRPCAASGRSSDLQTESPGHDSARLTVLHADLSCAAQDMETFLDTMSVGGSQAATSEVPFLGAVLHVQRKEFTAAQGVRSPSMN